MALTKVYNRMLGDSHIPSQTSQSGKFLTTDGTNASWNTVSTGVDGIVSTANATAITIDSSEKVGIGAPTPAARLNISNSSGVTFQAEGSNNEVVGRFKTTNAGFTDTVIYAQNTAGTGGSLIKCQNSGGTTFEVRGSGGITFNGDTAAANALDDYEEGTWTPTIGGGVTSGLTATDCVYTKIGNMVHLQGRVSGFSGFNSATLYFNGLPFNPQYSTSNALIATTFVDLDQGYQLWCHLSHGEAKIYFRYMKDNAQYNSLAGSDVSSSSNIYFNATYTTAS